MESDGVRISYILECIRRIDPWSAVNMETETRLYGPFSTDSEANVYLKVEEANGFCGGNHRIVEVKSMNLRSMLDDNGKYSLVNVISNVIADVKDDVLIEIAKATKPFTAASVDNSNGIPRHLTNKIATIKELRDRFPGLGLRQSKEIVDDWQAKGLVSFGDEVK